MQYEAMSNIAWYRYCVMSFTILYTKWYHAAQSLSKIYAYDWRTYNFSYSTKLHSSQLYSNQIESRQLESQISLVQDVSLGVRFAIQFHTSLTTQSQQQCTSFSDTGQIEDTASTVIKTAGSCIHRLYHSITTRFSALILPSLHS